MAPKKRNTNHHKQPLQLTDTLTTVKQECEKALKSLRLGNHTKALRLTKELSSNPQFSQHSALINRVKGTVLAKIAASLDDVNAKRKNLNLAVEAARTAVELRPDSIEFSHFYASLLFEKAEYEEVIKECDRGIGIECPLDPGSEGFSGRGPGSGVVTVESVRTELRGLAHRAQVGTLTSLMNSFGEERFRLVPIRRLGNEAGKSGSKSVEERRKEIEVRVAAAKCLQLRNEGEKGEGGEKGEKGEGSERGAEVKSGSGGGSRRRNLRRNGPGNEERKSLVMSYWDSMSLDMRKELLRIGVDDLKGYFGRGKDSLANEILCEALSWAGVNNSSWKFWACCRCDEKFVSANCLMRHVFNDHMERLSPEMQSVLPSTIEDDCAEMLLGCSWKPLDVSAAVEMLGSRSNSCESELLNGFYSGGHSDECVKDNWDSSPENGFVEKDCNGAVLETIDGDRVTGPECRERDGNQRSMSVSLLDSWPLADDSERAKLLGKIRSVFDMLIKHKYLAASHINKVVQFTIDELQGYAFGSHLLDHGFDRTPACVCFLGAPQLRKILKFLQEISHACGVDRYSENASTVDGCCRDLEGNEVKEEILLDRNASCLLLDERILSTESTLLDDKNEVLPISNCMLSWIFAGPTSGEHITSWMRMKEEKTRQGMEIIEALDKEFYHLQNLCERKREHLNYDEGLQAVEDICLEEGRKMDNAAILVHQNLKFVLSKRKEELVESENDASLINIKSELEAISNVLKEAEALNDNQFGYEETYSDVASQFCDLESGEDNCWRTNDYLHQMDNFIKVAIQRQKERLSIELSRIDARLLRNLVAMQQLELKLKSICALDNRKILLPLVKSYLRAYLEDLAEKDATKKSDAAREALLAELDRHPEKVGIGGPDSLKQLKDKPKDRKKNKESRKTKPSGETNRCNQNDKAVEQGSTLAGAGAHHPEDSEIVASSRGDNLRENEEEVKCRIELEAEERKLEETLEYQRRLEIEAKQRRLAEQQRKITQTHAENGDGLLKPKSDAGNNGQDDMEQLKPIEQWLDNVSVPTTTTNGASMPTKPSATSGSNYHYVNGQGEPNGRVVEDGFLPSDWKTKRRHRKHRNIAKCPDVRHWTVSSDKSLKPVRNTLNNGFVNQQVGSEDSLHNGNSLRDDNETKQQRPLEAEEEDVERFQAEIMKAGQQSLDKVQAHKKKCLISDSSSPRKMSAEVDGSNKTDSGVTPENLNGTDVIGVGLKNEAGEYNCFLNVIIQSLWHLRQFRDEFLSRSTSEHDHVGNPCAVCALHKIFTAFNISFIEMQREPVAPTPLRVALSNLYPDSSFLQEGQMNDASEVLEVLFDCLHKAFTPGSNVSHTKSVNNNPTGAWDCANSACIAHPFFGMDIFEQMNCYSCGLESRHLKYTTFFHIINASALRRAKETCPESSFDELLNIVEMNHQLACDPEVGGCGKRNYINHILSNSPHVFTTVLGWQNTCETVENIKATLAALSTELNMSVLYRGLDSRNTHNLVSVVCYYGRHYHCFAYSHDREQWIMYDDKTVKVVGGWDDVLSMCERGHLQPQVLFFEAVN